MIELSNVTKIYRAGRREVASVRGVSLRISYGEFVSIMGPSGSGKSTLLQLLGGLTLPTSGSVWFQGVDLRTLPDRELSLLRLKRFGFVFQFFNLLPTLSAVKNVALPLLLGGAKSAQARSASLAMLDRVNLRDRAEHLPEELSGGEMQRVALARALVTEPELVLCDEPTGSLDSQSGGEVLGLLRILPKASRRSVVMVTHDASAAAYGDRVIQVRDGRIEAEETLGERHACAPTYA